MEKTTINDNAAFDLGYIFRLILMQSKLIIFITIIGVAIGSANYFLAEKQYKISSLLQVFSKQNSFAPTDILDVYSSSSATSDLDNISQLYKSRFHILKVIDDMKLNLSFEDKKSKVYKRFLKVFNSSSLQEDFSINLYDENFSISSQNFDEIVIPYGVEYDEGGLNILFEKPQNKDLSSFIIRYFSPDLMYKIVSLSFVVTNSLDERVFISNRGNGFIEVDYYTSDPAEGIEILNHSNQIFIDEDIEYESKMARNAVEFLDKRIASIEDKLEADKNELKQFRESNRTVNVDLEIESILESMRSVDDRINQIDIEIARSSINYTPNNPAYLDLINQRSELQKQRTELDLKIDELPFAQQRYVDLFRNVETTQEIYSDLLSKKLEFSIREASTIGNIRIIDTAFIDRLVSPMPIDAIYTSIIFLLSALLIATIRGIFFLPITNPAELSDRNINLPIVGVTPFVDDDDEETDRLVGAIESVVVNIQSLNKGRGGCETILITSPTKENGKSFLSREIGKGFSTIGKKVLLLDADWKRGDQHKAFNIKKFDVESFNSLNSENISKLKVSENLYVLPKSTKLTNSFQFINSPSFDAKMKIFKEYFDVIILDTAPGLSVSDTSILMSYSDINFAVVRHEVTKLSELQQLLYITNQIGIVFDGIIYNSYKKPSSYYGYYGVYGNYAYQYYAKKYLYEGYDYENK